ncbi:MAG TPA: hypothetical protein VHC22_01845 [Pirellulales bacterium]|nr:hypothetical protein [Pirellulales bacterium]
MTRPANPLNIAREAQNMARNASSSNGQVFQTVAAVTMCMVTVLTGMHMLEELWRKLYRSDRQQGRGR